MSCQKKLKLFQLAEKADQAKDTETVDAWREFRKAVMLEWHVPDLTPENDSMKSEWVDRASALLKKLPHPDDGPHAKWLRAGEQPIEACLKHHNGEVRVEKVTYWVKWSPGEPCPADKKWCRTKEGGWAYESTMQMCYTLAQLFQYHWGSASDLYLRFLSLIHISEPTRPRLIS